MSRFKRTFEEQYPHLASSVFKFADACKFTPTWQQEQLLGCVQRGDTQIACRSGQGPGKTTCSVVIGLWRTLRRAGALTVVTAPTMRQCNEVWLAEARRIYKQMDPLLQKMIKITKTKIEICGDPDWAIKTVTATQDEKSQGFHEKNMTIIMEEASGISRKIIEQFEGTASNPGCMILQIGNPNTRDCAFFDSFHSQRHLWTCLNWNAEQTPASEWFDPARNDRLEAKYGRDSDIYRVRVLGEFPHADPNCVLSTEDLEKVILKHKLIEAARVRTPDGKVIRQMGIDFARYGGDENTIYRRSGNAIVQWGFWPHTDPSKCVATAYEWQRKAGWKNSQCMYVADAGGMGQGVMHLFHDADKNIMEFHNGGRALNSSQYDNKITEAWFHFADIVKSGKCYIPNDPLLIQQLCSRQYFMTRKGKICIESKDEYMKRGHDSPDRADGAVMAFYDISAGEEQTARK